MKCKNCGHELYFEGVLDRGWYHLTEKDKLGNVVKYRYDCPFCKCQNPEPEASRGEQGDSTRQSNRTTTAQSSKNPRNPESLKKCKECGLACGGGKKKEGSE